jgi:cyclophilin family peptidyl-prolyl cis-trans isomerase
MRMKKLLAAGMILAMLAGCGGAEDASSQSQSASQDGEEPQSQSQSQSAEQEGESEMTNPQLAEANGPVAVMKTSMGDITIQLYPEEAPKAVENFITHAKEGYYDGIVFHRVINDFMIQGGDPTATGRGGESIWGDSFEDEFSSSLHNFRGALSMANAGTNTNGSQFFIVQCGDKLTDSDAQNTMLQWTVNRFQWQLNTSDASSAQALMDELNAKLTDYQQNGLPQEYLDEYEPAIQRYKEVGGTPHLDYKHTVFGQVIDGMDVVDAIAAVATDGNDKPLEDVTILSIEIQE